MHLLPLAKRQFPRMFLKVHKLSSSPRSNDKATNSTPKDIGPAPGPQWLWRVSAVGFGAGGVSPKSPPRPATPTPGPWLPSVPVGGSGHRRCLLPQCAVGGRRTLGVTAGGVWRVMLRAPVGCHFRRYHAPSRPLVGWLSTQGLPSPSFCPSLQITNNCSELHHLKRLV